MDNVQGELSTMKKQIYSGFNNLQSGKQITYTPETHMQNSERQYGELASKNFPGWVLLMKAHGSDFDHDHPAWTSHHLHNDEDTCEKTPGNAKYETFNNMKLKKLMFVDA